MFVLLLAIGIAGCKPRDVARETQNTKPEKLTARCDDLLSFSLDMLRPERLEISSRRDDAINNLNHWKSTCGQVLGLGQHPSAGDEDNLLERLLSPEVLKRVRRDHYSERDGSHIRDCLLSHRIVSSGKEVQRTDLERAVSLFDFVVRQITLSSHDFAALPLTPYEFLMLGRGSPEDRAWLFVNLLRQLQIDAVILRPQKLPEVGADPRGNPGWLVGVLLNQEVYLFDARLGLPIPVDSKNPKTVNVEKPATLAQVISDESLLAWLDVDENHLYSLRSKDLEKPRVEVVGTSSFWARRLFDVQQAMSGEDACIVYDRLQDGELGPGLVSRVAAAGRNWWSRDDIAVWSYPEDRFHAAENRSSNQEERLRVEWQPFQEPREFKYTVDPNTGRARFDEPEFKAPEWSLLKTRTQQLLGEYVTAVQSYLSLRLRRFRPDWPIPDEIKHMHVRAVEDAFYWGGVCKFERQQFESAAPIFKDYANRYPQGKWLSASRYLRALCLAETDQRDQAISTLNEVSPNDPSWDGFQLLIRRWRTVPPAKK